MKAPSTDNSPPFFLDTTELLILEDGRILVHNLTPDVAAMLHSLKAEDERMRQRAAAAKSTDPEFI